MNLRLTRNKLLKNINTQGISKGLDPGVSHYLKLITPFVFVYVLFITIR